jgi:glucose-1-phosphate thymidylyltransferase
MNGLILAGGYGTRLFPLTKVVNKHLLPIYNKPMIFYSLSTIMLAGAKNILIVSTNEYLSSFEKLLGDGSQFGVKISYSVQEKPIGLPDGIKLANNFFGTSPIIMILGDNIFHGVGLGKHLKRFTNRSGCTILGFRVSDPSNYGVIEINENSEIVSLLEKPIVASSNIAITGLYFFDENAAAFVNSLKPSKRNETEIVDLLNIYLARNLLNFEMLPRGTAWFDTGTFEGIYEASTYIKVVESRTGMQIGNPYEISKQSE